MSTILRQAPAAHAFAEPQLSALGWKHEQARVQAMHRRRSRHKPKRAAPRVPDFLRHLPCSSQDALMRSADAIDHYEKAKALSAGVSQSESARKLTSGEGTRLRSTGSVHSSGGSSRGGSRRSHHRMERLESLSAPVTPDLPPAASEPKLKERAKSGSVGELEIRPLGAPGGDSKAEADAVMEARRKRRERREARRDAAKEAAHVGLPPIKPIASGSITMTIAANGKEGMGLLVGREASELAELGGLISPSAIESFDFSAAFMTPEMIAEKKQR